MKTLSLFASSLAILLALIHASAAQTAPSAVNYRAGRYVGSMQVTTTVAGDPFLSTSATLRLRGRATGDATMTLVGTPQNAAPIGRDTDDYLMKYFVLLPDPLASEPKPVVFREWLGLDSNGGATNFAEVDAQTVTPTNVTVRIEYPRGFAGQTFDVKVVIRLRRIGP